MNTVKVFVQKLNVYGGRYAMMDFIYSHEYIIFYVSYNAPAK